MSRALDIHATLLYLLSHVCIDNKIVYYFGYIKRLLISIAPAAQGGGKSIFGSLVEVWHQQCFLFSQTRECIRYHIQVTSTLLLIAHASANYQPHNFSRRYSNTTFDKSLVKISPSCSCVSTFTILIPRRTICSLNQIVSI